MSPILIRVSPHCYLYGTLYLSKRTIIMRANQMTVHPSLHIWSINGRWYRWARRENRHEENAKMQRVSQLCETELVGGLLRPFTTHKAHTRKFVRRPTQPDVTSPHTSDSDVRLLEKEDTEIGHQPYIWITTWRRKFGRCQFSVPMARKLVGNRRHDRRMRKTW